MQHLDRDSFSTSLTLLAARVPATRTTQFMQQDAKDYILRLRSVGAVAPDQSQEHRRVLLRTVDRAALPADLLDMLKRHDVDLVEHEVKFGYDYFTSDQILQAVLPEELLDESPTAFTQVGHIAHLNLREQYLPHKHLIGQVILDKNPKLRTVVNKLDMIDNVYRNFQMEVLAGDPDFVVEMAEHDCKFRFDFSKVYWNSRLQTEHARLVATFSPDEVIVDGFAGVGPFAIPAGKKGCAVLASDLNPASAEALKENAALNKVERNVRTFNEDGRDFIRRSVLAIWNEPFPPYVPPLSARERSRRARAANAAKAAAKAAAASSSSSSPSAAAPSPSAPAATDSLASLSLSTDTAPDDPPAPSKPTRRLPNHYIMNLPASALTFLDAFRGLYRPLYDLVGEDAAKEAIQEAGGLPVVHCYCFTKEIENAERDICQRATDVLGFEVHPGLDAFAVRFVRDVAPRKEMFVLEFRLTDEMVR
ncbi:tRNA guanine-N1-methyltransferase [Rhodotorula diobovata]|uniref:tRNA (guanine(37)-N1)-methyltransferase n=1 Tax=Rhodotorula diobovata TaxID=5288 RepID=A0A5C5FXY2_9BASI|nr:tRNA guanine-N1-methyltransferase [Rhodotorula diobovata]